jgi:hypothetical protein
MSFLNTRIMDLGLQKITDEASRIDICSQEPATYTEATSTYSKGFKSFGAGSTFGAPATRSPTGRKVSSVAVTDGAVTATATATHWAVSDAPNTRLVAAYTLAASQVVTNGNAWSLASFDIGIPAPA